MTERPSARLASALHAAPGHVVTVAGGSRWRWDGADWHPLRAGDTALSSEGDWYLFDGKDFKPAQLAAGAVCRVAWFRDGVVWDGELVGVEQLESWRDEPGAHVRLWPDSQETAHVPLSNLELIAPAGEVPHGA